MVNAPATCQRLPGGQVGVQFAARREAEPHGCDVPTAPRGRISRAGHRTRRVRSAGHRSGRPCASQRAGGRPRRRACRRAPRRSATSSRSRAPAASERVDAPAGDRVCLGPRQRGATICGPAPASPARSAPSSTPDTDTTGSMPAPRSTANRAGDAEASTTVARGDRLHFRSSSGCRSDRRHRCIAAGRRPTSDPAGRPAGTSRAGAERRAAGSGPDDRRPAGSRLPARPAAASRRQQG